MDEIVIAAEIGSAIDGKKPAGSDKPEKKLKSDVNYSRGTRAAHCGVCKHFHWPTIEDSIRDGTCDIVTGLIDCAKWCTEFKKS